MANKVFIAEDKDDPIECIGYKTKPAKLVLCYILYVLTLGFLLLVFYWRKDWKLKATANVCSIEDADALLIKDVYKRQHVSYIQNKTLAGLLIYRDLNKEKLSKDMKEILKRDVIRDNSIRFVKFQKIHYIWDPNSKTFFKLRALDGNTPCSDFYNIYQEGLTDEQAIQRREIYGFNQIVIRVKPILLLLVQEVLNPFYIFQLFSVSVWIADEYYYYAVCIILMSCISIGVSLYTTRTQSVTLRNMVYSDTVVQVLRNGEKMEIHEDLLVPGDVVIIPPRGCSMTCDAVLLSGNCVVNESMLTGESVPVTKIPLPRKSADGISSEIYSPEKHKRNTLFCGTRIIQTRGVGQVKAVIVQTGFSTAKGNMVRSILYPRPTEIKLHRDAVRFVIMLSCMAGIGFIYTLIVMVKAGSPAKVIALRSLDIITIAVPPALPASLTIGMVYAQLRLKAQGIFCISPTRINLCGMIDVVCFDKTGTLTEDGLDLMGVQQVFSKRFAPMQKIINSLNIGRVISAMATCHSLTMIDEELAGDPIDLKMFQATGWVLHEPELVDGPESNGAALTVVKAPRKYVEDENDVYYEIGIIRQFPFSSQLQRMSVITHSKQVKEKDEQCQPIEVFVKGAPEMVVSLSRPDTVPDDFADVLDFYTRQGFRVLALAHKTFDNTVDLPRVSDITRDEVECDLEFLGILILQNQLKPETKPVIKQLRKAQITTKMVTGDNILTAINVARKCAMVSTIDNVYRVTFENGNIEYTLCPPIDEDINEHVQKQKEDDVAISITRREHFAIDGKTFESIRAEYPDELEKIAVKGTVFARMSPEQKTQLVDILQRLEYSVGMCGDGANDCGALKTAHAGIALCEAEASVAAPFTSKTPNITCVPTAIREGRAALMTSFGMFKFMALYSMIQFVSVMILYSVQSNLSDVMFLYIDIVVCTSVVLLMGRTEAYGKISSKKPPKELMNHVVIFSIFTQVCVQSLVQVFAFLAVKNQLWYDPEPVPPEDDPDDKNLVLYESTSVFLVSSFQYIIIALIYTPGPPYRKPIYTNVLYVIAMVVITFYTLFLLFFIPDPLLGPMDMIHIPEYRFKFVLFGLVVINTFISLVVEYFFVRNKRFMDLVSCQPCRTQDVQKFRRLEMLPVMEAAASRQQVADESAVVIASNAKVELLDDEG